MATRTCKVLSWNVRGINSDKKWDVVRDKIVESSCDLVCLQETKKESFDLLFIRKICPSAFDAFDYIPAHGASGGSVIIWKSSLFLGTKIFQNDFCLSLEMCSKFDDDTWILSNIYAPCTYAGKRDFLRWFKNVSMPDMIK